MQPSFLDFLKAVGVFLGCISVGFIVEGFILQWQAWQKRKRRDRAFLYCVEVLQEQDTHLRQSWAELEAGAIEVMLLQQTEEVKTDSN